MEKLTHQQIVERQKEKLKKPRIRACVILNNIRSLYNVGSIFRTADGAGFEKLWLCGITGCPKGTGCPKSTETPPSNMISKTALGAEEVVSWEYRENAADVIKDLRKKVMRFFFLSKQTKVFLLSRLN